MVREIVFYTTESGRCPVKEFLDELPFKAAKKVSWVIQFIEDCQIIPRTYFKKLSGTDEIWECRIQQGSNAYRIFAFFVDDRLVLTHGIQKKTWKLPKNEIERAEHCRSDYLGKVE